MSDSKLFNTFRLAVWTVISTINCLLSQCSFWMERTFEIGIITKISTAKTRSFGRWVEARKMLPTLGNASIDENTNRPKYHKANYHKSCVRVREIFNPLLVWQK